MSHGIVSLVRRFRNTRSSCVAQKLQRSIVLNANSFVICPIFGGHAVSSKSGGEDDVRMTEYEMPIEEQINRLAREFKSFGTKLDSIDSRLTTVAAKIDATQSLVENTHALATRTEARLEETHALATRTEARLEDTHALATRTEARLEDTHALATRTHDQLQKTHALATRTHVLMEDTHDVAKLGLEGVQGLRESMDGKFAAAAKTNAEQTELLKSLFVHVRKRVERVEPPKRRRRT
jgi:chromosome segregation ATPase